MLAAPAMPCSLLDHVTPCVTRLEKPLAPGPPAEKCLSVCWSPQEGRTDVMAVSEWLSSGPILENGPRMLKKKHFSKTNVSTNVSHSEKTDVKIS